MCDDDDDMPFDVMMFGLLLTSGLTCLAMVVAKLLGA